jgi:transposase, IS5 family
MRPVNLSSEPIQDDLFRSSLEQMLNHDHSLYRLALEIDWMFFEREFGPLFDEGFGRPGLPTRLMVGLHYLKHAFNFSDEAVVAGFVENPYWQIFCGYSHFQHEFPCDPTSLVKWRKRIGVKGVEKLLKETIQSAKRAKELKPTDVAKVNVDTTVQEKAIAFPTDSRLYQKMRRSLVGMAEARGIHLRQSYERVGKRALRKQSQYAAAKQMRRARREAKRLRIFLGRVIRDIARKCLKPDQELEHRLVLARRIFGQKRDDKNKVYSVHAPEVECIAKGKAHKKYEFGCKVSLVTTSRKGWVVGIDAHHGNPYDGHTLKPAIEQTRQLTGLEVEQIFVDKGYRGSQNHPEGVSVFLAGRRGLKASLKAWLKRRSAIEPVIGHLKHDNRMDRNYLLGKDGDRMNAMLCGAGWNLRKLMRAFLLSFFGIEIRQLPPEYFGAGAPKYSGGFP